MKRPVNPLVGHLTIAPTAAAKGLPVTTLCGKKRVKAGRRWLVCGTCVDLMVTQVNERNRDVQKRMKDADMALIRIRSAERELNDAIGGVL